MSSNPRSSDEVSGPQDGQAAPEQKRSSDTRSSTGDPLDGTFDVDTYVVSRPRAEDASNVQDGAEADDRDLDPTTLSPGKDFGRYRIERELGRGAMGEVFLARDRQLDRLVAIKTPQFNSESEQATEKAVARFYREARAMATVQHAGLCPVYDVGQIDGRHYISMAYIDGVTLVERLSKGPDFPEVEAAQLMQKIARALHAAHQAGIVHRDLKPGNIMVRPDGEPMVMDFGVAARNVLGEAELTHTGDMVGTPAYMSPEQVQSQHDEIDARSDVWALGVLLYILLTRQRPFDGRYGIVIARILHSEPVPIAERRPGVSPEIVAIAAKAMTKALADRYQSAEEFADALGEFIRTDSELSPQDPSSGSAAGSAGRSSAELRQVSVVLFSLDDPELSLDPEQHEDAARSFAKIVQSHVEAAGGAILSTDGSQVQACFGFPVAHEDSVLRAIHAGRTVLADLDPDSLPARIAGVSAEATVAVVVHTGEAVARQESQDGSLSITGEVRNTVQRLEAVSHPGSVIVTAATHARVELFFQWESLGETRIRGVAEPVELFQVLAQATTRSRVDLVDPGNLTPLVGRDTELNILKDRWELAQDELGQVVVLIGDAGLGKSRLIREIRDHVNQQDGDTATVIELRCSEWHTNSSFFPAVEYLQRLFQFEDVTDARPRQALIEWSLHETGLHSSENLGLFASLLSVPVVGTNGDTVPPPAISPQRLMEKTQELLLAWLHARAQKQPVLFIVEDLHWADASTLDLLMQHVTTFTAGPLLTLLTFRPEFETPWPSSPHQTQIALNRLPRRQIARMVHQRTGRDDVPDWLITQLTERTDGIPLFIEEFCNLVQESGMLDGDAADAGASEAAVLSIPNTLQDLMIARLDRMESNPEVVQLAATIGREFSWQLLSAASELDEPRLQQELEKLVQTEVLFQKGQVPEAQYIFKHALIQDAAYNSLLKKRKQQFHTAIAEALEQQFSEIAETQPALLAHHLTEAALPDRAIPYWLRAGQESQARSANNEAISSFQRGLEVLATLPESPERDGIELGFQAPLGVSLLAAKGYACPEAGPVFARARELAERVADPATDFFIRWGIYAWRVVRCDLPIAIQISDELKALSTQLNDPIWECEFHFAYLCAQYYQGQFSDARHHGEQSRKLFDDEKCRANAQGTGQDLRSTVRAIYANTLWTQGFPEQAITIACEAVDLFRTENHPMSFLFACHFATWVLMSVRRWEEALELAEEAKRYSIEQGGFQMWTATSECHAGICEIHLGRLEIGLARAVSGNRDFQGTGANLGVARNVTEIAAGHLTAGNLHEAQSFLDDAFARARDPEIHERHHLAETHRIQGELLLARHPESPDKAEAEFRKAREVARAQAARSFELRAVMKLARLHQSTEQAAEWRDQLQTLLDKFTEGRELPDLADARSLLDELT